MRCVLVGNYGVGNLGDEALKGYFLQRFPEVEWVTVSVHPGAGQVPRLPCGIRSLFQPWWSTVKAIRQADVVVFGGGTLFTDIESVYACILWWWHVCVARALGARVALEFQGIGPFHTKIGEWFARSAVYRCHHISVRDKHSYSRVESWNLNRKIVQTFDPVILLLEDKKFDVRTKNIFTVIPRMNSGDSFRKRVQTLLKEHPEWTEVRILSLAPDDPQEKQYCESIRALCSVPAQCIGVRTLEELTKNVQTASYVLSERYHGALVALGLGVPFEVVQQKQEDKLSSLRSQDAAMCRALAQQGESEFRSWLQR
jgi:polysaccharide pyruvyl transferase WcaK-like protein